MEYVNKQRRNLFLLLHLDMPVNGNGKPGPDPETWSGDPNFGSERSVELFYSELLISHPPPPPHSHSLSH